MAGFEPGISIVTSDRSDDRATTTAALEPSFHFPSRNQRSALNQVQVVHLYF